MNTVNSWRIALLLLLLSFSLAFGQSAQTSFDRIKALAGTWRGISICIECSDRAQ